MKLNIYTVDAFTEVPFEGNPAAIVPLTEELPESLMQKIAFELNLSETAFVTAPPNSASPWTDGGRFGLRWFTPAREIPLCGHATLAAAHTLFNILGNTSSSLKFDTLSGTLITKRQDDGIVMDFPSNPPKPLTESQKTKYSSLISVIAGQYQVKEVVFSPTAGKLLVRLDDVYSRNDFESIQPSASELLRVNDGSEVRGVILTLKGDLDQEDTLRGVAEHHFISRYFAQWVGIYEDPVTGSAHTVSGPYWSEELGIKDLKCRQCSKRGGELTLRIRDDNRVDIFGKATTVIQGEINV